MGETELQRCLVQDTKTTKKGERIGEEGRDGGGMEGRERSGWSLLWTPAC